MAVAMLVCSMTGLSACKKKNDKNDDDVTESVSKSTTSAVSQIVEVPKEKDKIVQMFDSAIGYVDEFCYSYTKTKKNIVKDLGIGELSKVNNAADAFKSIFGEGQSQVEYNYNYSKENFDANFPKQGVKYEDVESATATKKDDSIIITLNFPAETDPTHEKGRIHNYTNDFLSAEDVKDSLGAFGSAAGSISVNIESFKMVAVIRAHDSSLEKLTMSFTENYNLSGVKLVEVNGSTVTGKMVSTIDYTQIG